MSRATMAPLILRVRQEAGDPLTSVFTDDDLQQALEEHKFVAVDLPLEPVWARDGSVPQFWAPIGYWEGDGDGTIPTFKSSSLAPLTATTTDLMSGVFTFTGAQPPVYITGSAYDLYAAAADICERWASKLARAYDMSDDKISLSRSQMAAGLRDQARLLRQRAYPNTIQTGRGDMGSGNVRPYGSW